MATKSHKESQKSNAITVVSESLFTAWIFRAFLCLFVATD